MDNSITSRSFFSTDPALSWKTAAAYAGEGGRVATVKDIIEARVANSPNSEVWNNYYTTISSEYIGLSKAGVPVAVVCHGNGPLQSQEDWIKAYEQREEHHCQSNGYIDIEKFHDLIDGKYGDVTVIDLSDYAVDGGRQFPYYHTLEDAVSDPWVVARFGGDANLVKAYITKVRALAKAENQDRHTNYFVRFDLGHGAVNRAGNAFKHLELSRYLADGKLAAARLLTVTQVTNTFVSGEGMKVSLLTEIDHHGRGDGTRFVGIRGSENADIHDGDVFDVATFNPERITVPHTGEGREFEQLIEVNGKLFVETPKTGCVMDSGYPIHHLLSSSKIDSQKRIHLGEPASPFFFKYDTAQVIEHAPEGANAFHVVWKGQDQSSQTVEVQFYKIKADYDTRILSKDEVNEDIDLMMKLFGITDEPTQAA